MIESVNLGYPRIGAHRELKQAVEAYWDGDRSQDELRETARTLRRRHWEAQNEAGIDHIPSNDFSFYDQVLDAAAMVGAVPERFSHPEGEPVGLDPYFDMARGIQEKEAEAGQPAAHAMEMTKWFDTNYHYIVPELREDQDFALTSTKPVDEFTEAKDLGIHTRPVLIGPVSFLLLSKTTDDSAPLDLLERLLPVYEELLQRLADAGATDVQLDEPFLALDLSDEALSAYERAYDRLSQVEPSDLDLHLTTYFDGLRSQMEPALNLPVASVHLDLVRAPEQLSDALALAPDDVTLSLGVIDGRNVWRADLDAKLKVVQEAARELGPERVMVGPSCSLLHVPVDLETEPDLGEEARSWLAFAKQKLDEIAALARAANSAEDDRTERAFEAARRAKESRAESGRVNDPDVQARADATDDAMLERDSPFEKRRVLQQEALGLPPLPTTTIGSFPQTGEVRRKRSAFKKGDIDRAEYESFLEGVTEDTIRRQEDIGLDVLVHGEAERSDMVEYFGQRMEGFLFTQNAWVQSYGSRCVRPPIIFGDVSRPDPMTVRWSEYAQSLTDKPVKGMLTGPVTILQWSFVRDDQPREETCRQIALAIRDEVADLEEAGLSIIQVDEPALREGLPLRQSGWADYLDWSVGAFRLATAGAADATQIHTHMCYSEFNEIIDAIAAMDADVISMEASRSKMELLEAFEEFDYPNQIGPGVYDIHSPRVPSQEEIAGLIDKALDALPADQLWVNPDCGLKTRRWEEVEPSLNNMVAAADQKRDTVAA
ncbi:MAG: 5-methyltetrahydropteroyltriglutamate--homocysteine S-methyltransferase [Bacteroidetes bacterium QS_8_68_15]|nr:MAG: 5-methyltetrahydropteroyltriglutamate--homocysteine S-methyltransferase [Bacteroidetes bacterium QS_8_68_15]